MPNTPAASIQSAAASRLVTNDVRVFDLDELRYSATAALFDGRPRAGSGTLEQTFLGRDPA